MSSVTGIILSYNRHYALRRQLLYYRNKPIHLIIADGSDQDLDIVAKGSCGQMSWEYFRITGYHSFSQRLLHACLLVKTEYVLFIEDEEPTLWTGIEKAVRFLGDNPDHSCAGGRVDHMRFYSGRLGIMKWRHWGNYFEIIDSMRFSRLASLLRSGRTVNLIWQVMRSRDIKRFARIPQAEFFFRPGRYIGLYELGLSGFLTICGKWQMGDYPFWIRYGGSQKIQLQTKNFDAEDEKIIVGLFTSAVSDFEVDTSGFQFILERELRSEEFLRIFNVMRSQTRVNNLIVANVGNLETAILWQRLRQFLKNLFVKFSFLVWRVAPSLHRVLRPNGVRRLKTHAKIYGNGDNKIIDDLLLVEKIWGRFPNGLSQSQYEQELARV